MIQPNAHNGLGGFSAWPAQARASSDEEPAAAGSCHNKTLHPTECPNGSSDLFRLGSPSQGILFFYTRACAQAKGKRESADVGARRMPTGLGGFSAFNSPRPGASCEG